MNVHNDGILETEFSALKCFSNFSLNKINKDFLPSVLLCLGLNSRSPLSETKSTSSSLSALSDSLNSSEGGDLTHGNEELRGLLALPSSAGSQSSSGSHSGSGTEDKPDKGKEQWGLLQPHTLVPENFKFEVLLYKSIDPPTIIKI